MTRLARARCAYYATAFLALANVSTYQAVHGAWWAAAVLGVASLAPVVSMWMEGEHSLTQHRAAHVIHHLASDLAQYQEHEVHTVDIDGCCDRWWTSAGAEHETECETQNGRRAA